MPEYRNIMEELLEEEYDKMPTIDCCRCTACRNDVIAYALNLIPPKYVATRKGEVYSKVLILRNQYRTDMMSALAKAAEVVKANPRH